MQLFKLLMLLVNLYHIDILHKGTYFIGVCPHLELVLLFPFLIFQIIFIQFIYFIIIFTVNQPKTKTNHFPPGRALKVGGWGDKWCLANSIQIHKKEHSNLGKKEQQYTCKHFMSQLLWTESIFGNYDILEVQIAEITEKIKMNTVVPTDTYWQSTSIASTDMRKRESFLASPVLTKTFRYEESVTRETSEQRPE